MKYFRIKISFLISIIIIMLFTQMSICKSYKNIFSMDNKNLSYEDWSKDWQIDSELPIKICILPGKDESVINLSWYSKDGDKESKLKFYSENSVKDIKVNHQIIGNGFISNKAEIKHLRPNKKYYYRYTVNGKWSPKFYINTKNNQKYSFVFLGDPQIGASYKSKNIPSYKDAIKIDTYNWNRVINSSIQRIKNCSFILCGGDETNTINNYTYKEKETISNKEYSGFLYPEYLRHIPIVNIIGNHDKDNIDFYYHFKNSTMSKLGKTLAGGDYYFRYNNTLFLILNTNNLNINEHKQFINEAIKSNTDIDWRIAVFHHDIYGGGIHTKDNDIKYLRENLPPILENNKIDLVFNGHDHIYSRSKRINGIVYITGGSSTGSKFYKYNKKQNDFIKIKFDKEIPTYTIVNVSLNKINIITYRLDNNKKIDSYYILKE